MVDISGAVVVVTRGTRGLGKVIVDELLARGAAKVYATSRSAKDSACNSRDSGLDLDSGARKTVLLGNRGH